MTRPAICNVDVHRVNMPYVGMFSNSFPPSGSRNIVLNVLHVCTMISDIQSSTRRAYVQSVLPCMSIIFNIVRTME